MTTAAQPEPVVTDPAAAPAAVEPVAAPEPTPDPVQELRDRLARGEEAFPSTEEPAAPAPTGEGEPAEGEESVQTEEVTPEGAEEGGEVTEAGETEVDNQFVVTLEGLEDKGEKPLELYAPDEESFNRLNRLQNEAQVGRDVKTQRQQIQDQRAELTAVEDMMAIDPTQFMLDHIPDAVRDEVAMQLVFAPKVFDAIQTRLHEAGVEGGIAEILENPEGLRALRAELETSRLKMGNQLREQGEKRKVLEASAQRVATTISDMIPEHIAGDARNLLFQDAVRDVKERCERLGIDNPDADDVKLIVSGRLRRQGISLSASPDPAPGGKAPAAAAAAPAGRTGAQFKEAQKLRIAAAAAAPPGAGTPAVTPRPELPKGTKDTIKKIRSLGENAADGLRRALGRA